MKTFKQILESVVTIGGGNLATFDVPLNSSPIKRYRGSTKTHNVSDIGIMNKAIKGKKKYSRWKKIFGEDFDYEQIKKDYYGKNDVILNEPRSGIMLYLKRK